MGCGVNIHLRSKFIGQRVMPVRVSHTFTQVTPLNKNLSFDATGYLMHSGMFSDYFI